jgi:hypothetical protein
MSNRKIGNRQLKIGNALRRSFLLDPLVPAAGTPGVGGFSLLEGVMGGEWQALYSFTFFVIQFGPRFQASFVAPRTGIFEAHVK